MKNELEKLYQYIDANKENILNDLMDICRIESVSLDGDTVQPFGQGCKDVLNAMLAKGTKEGFVATNHEYYVGSIKYDVNQKENIGILAHLDVVPAGEDWTVTEPYHPIIKDGYMYGRGCSDDKSGAIAGLYIQKAFRDCGISLNHNIEVLLGTNEETHMHDMEYYTAHYKAPKFTFVPDGGFPGCGGEFGRLRYILTSKNSLSDDFVDLKAGSAFNIIPNKATVVLNKNTQIDYASLPEDFDVIETKQGIQITAYGVTSHAAHPEGGKNAIRVLTDALVHLKGVKSSDLAILSFINNVNEDCYGTYLGIANTDEISGQTVSSGTILRLENGKVSLGNDCRRCISDNNDRLEAAIIKKCNENEFTLEVDERTNGYALDVNGPVISAIKETYQQYTGDKEAEITIMKGGTYAGMIPNGFATGCVLGREQPDLPAGHGHAHQPDEFLNIEGYMNGIKLLMSMIYNVEKIL